MTEQVKIQVDGKTCEVPIGEPLPIAIKEFANVPTLCWFDHIDPPLGTCRVCTIRVNGREVAGCTYKIEGGESIEVDSADLVDMRKALIELLFVEGNHFCPSCEKSGDCDLQALAYEMNMEVSRFPYAFKHHEVDSAGEKILLEKNRCILCKRCVHDVKISEKSVFSFLGRGEKTEIHMDHELEKKLTEESVNMSVSICPVGAILKRGEGFQTPYGNRKYDEFPISEKVKGRLPHYKKTGEKNE